MSVQSTTTDRGNRRTALAGAAICLGTAALGFAGEPAAQLLPPRPAVTFVSRASDDEIVQLDSPAPVVKARQRDPDFQYPPPYSKQDNSFGFLSFWSRSPASKKDDDKNDQSAAAPADETQKPALAHLQHRKRTAGHAPSSVRTAAVAATGLPPAETPAWHWYGYGAPVPGRNPYAPDGVYTPVNPEWYKQTGATPGAVPRPLPPTVPQAPTLPPPSPVPVESPRLMSQPPEKPDTALAPGPDLKIRPATLSAPVERPALAVEPAPELNRPPQPPPPPVERPGPAVGLAPNLSLTPQPPPPLAARPAPASDVNLPPYMMPPPVERPAPAPDVNLPPYMMPPPVERPAATMKADPDLNIRPATIEFPVPMSPSPAPSGSWKPLSARFPAPVVRSQAPEPDLSDLGDLGDSLRTACVGLATRIELRTKGPTSVHLRLTPAPGIPAERLADRIVHLSELAGYEIEMEFLR